MFKKLAIPMLAFACSTSTSVLASAIPYGNIGSEAPITAFIASATGNITAYFFSSNASYSSQIGLRVNGTSTGIFGLPNHGSSYGSSINLGNVSAGDVLEFELQVLNTGASWFSNPSSNSDGINHVNATPFAGDDIIPAGTHVGFEDLPGQSDFDYNDHEFVFTNVGNGRVAEAPEPESLTILGIALIALGVFRKKRAA